MTKVLSIGVHCDDCEGGMGGTAALLSENGCDVTFLYLTYNKLSQTPEKDEAQSRAAAEVLGAEKITLSACERGFYTATSENILKQKKLYIK